MKILIIPDIHGEKHWKKNFLENIDKVDKCIFLGDYVDNFNEDCKGENAALNFEDVIKTTEPYKSKTKILLGNHDLSYIYQMSGSPYVSGHQNSMTYRYNDMFINNIDRLDIAVKYDNWVFSHAGFSKNWYKYTKLGYDIIFKRHDEKVPAGPIKLTNWMLHKDKNLGMLNFSDNGWDPSGNNICQGPLWIRIPALFSDMYYKFQFVGHSEICKEEKPVLITNENYTKSIICLDSNKHNLYFILDTKIQIEELIRSDNLQVLESS